MAAVYLAEQQSLARRVAVKVLNEELCRDDASVDRFVHEARSAASLVHANIVQVYEVGLVDGRHYLAQEYVPGGTLGQLMERSGALSPERTVGVIWQVTEALSAASERGLVHRDIKPDNLMLDRSGVVKVADFGLARIAEPSAPRMTQAGVTMGTPLYMSPEQIEGRELDARSDLYSLGVTAYHLLSGEPPFSGETALAVAVRHLNEPAPSLLSRRSDLPDELVELVHRLMNKKPDDRYASPTDLLEALRDVAARGESSGWIDPEGSVGRSLGALPAVAARTGSDELKRLAESMAASTELTKRAGGWGKRFRWALLALVAGALLAVFLRPASLLPNRSRGVVEREANAKLQLYQAKRIDTPESWQAVIEYFPDASESQHLLALRGFVSSCLSQGEYRRAVPAIERLTGRAIDYPEFALFGQAGRVVVLAARGQSQAARQALSAIDPGDLESLERVSPGMASELERAKSRLELEPTAN